MKIRVPRYYVPRKHSFSTTHCNAWEARKWPEMAGLKGGTVDGAMSPCQTVSPTAPVHTAISPPSLRLRYIIMRALHMLRKVVRTALHHPSPPCTQSMNFPTGVLRRHRSNSVPTTAPSLASPSATMRSHAWYPPLHISPRTQSNCARRRCC